MPDRQVTALDIEVDLIDSDAERDITSVAIEADLIDFDSVRSITSFAIEADISKELSAISNEPIGILENIVSKINKLRTINEAVEIVERTISKGIQLLIKVSEIVQIVENAIKGPITLKQIIREVVGIYEVPRRSALTLRQIYNDLVNVKDGESLSSEYDWLFDGSWTPAQIEAIIEQLIAFGSNPFFNLLSWRLMMVRRNNAVIQIIEQNVRSQSILIAKSISEVIRIYETNSKIVTFQILKIISEIIRIYEVIVRSNVNTTYDFDDGIFPNTFYTPDTDGWTIIQSGVDSSGTWERPFASTSIWYQPIGAGASYIDAEVTDSAFFMRADECILVNTPGETERGVWTNDVGWDLEAGSRCDEDDYAGFDVPIPDDFIVPDFAEFDTPNNPGAIVMTDGTTIKQFQPFTRCTDSGNVTYLTGALYSDDDIVTGDGLFGAQGGSGMSSLGGVWRLGEGMTEGDIIPHALKLEMNAEEWYSATSGPGGGVGYRWPASTADDCAPGCYGGSVPEMQPGALCALPSTFDIDSLETEAGKIVARTLYVYGGYVVDSTSFDSYAICTERSPDGRLVEEFETTWGFPFNVDDASNDPWGRDMQAVFGALHVIDDNSPTNIGGGSGDTLTGFQLQSGSPAGPEESSSLTLTARSNSISFYWKASCHENNYGQFYIDGVNFEEISGTTPYTFVEVTGLTSSVHIFEWRYNKVVADVAADDCIFLDQVHVTGDVQEKNINTVISFESALAPLTTSGHVNWAINGSESYDGIISAKSGTISNNQSSTLTFSQRTTDLGFWLRGSSETNNDKLTFKIDGGSRLILSGSSTHNREGWGFYYFYDLPNTVHTFEWIYSKNPSSAFGSDAYWIDQIEYLNSSGAIIVNEIQGIIERIVSQGGTIVQIIQEVVKLVESIILPRTYKKIISEIVAVSENIRAIWRADLTGYTPAIEIISEVVGIYETTVKSQVLNLFRRIFTWVS